MLSNGQWTVDNTETPPGRPECSSARTRWSRESSVLCTASASRKWSPSDIWRQKPPDKPQRRMRAERLRWCWQVGLDYNSAILLYYIIKNATILQTLQLKLYYSILFNIKFEYITVYSTIVWQYISNHVAYTYNHSWKTVPYIRKIILWCKSINVIQSLWSIIPVGWITTPGPIITYLSDQMSSCLSLSHQTDYRDTGPITLSLIRTWWNQPRTAFSLIMMKKKTLFWNIILISRQLRGKLQVWKEQLERRCRWW